MDPPAHPKPTKKQIDTYPAQLISHLPLAADEASKTFVALPTNHHQFASLGRSHQDDDSMICDCTFRPSQDEPYLACGDGSDCINRLTQVECLASECKSGKYCNNQRFTRREYANVEVVMTEKKGFGLRAASNIQSEDFIYEYIGEVVQKANFLKRMQAYVAEGIRHFYFMELQKDEYLDATKKGGIGRFINHSCNPNCFVAKWVVGKRMRMGIFAKRDILIGEELTFNYNVDRYGHEAQPCYCNEPNCVGTLGGKTQTDVAGMDDLYLDALGITDEVEQFGLKGNKKKKGRKLDVDFIPVLKPIVLCEVPKVVAAVRQSTANRAVLCKLLSRVTMTDDQTVQRQILRMHGFSLMNTLLKEFPEDKEVVKLTLESMRAWPLINRNKVDDSKIEVPVNALVERFSNDEQFVSLAKNLLDWWSSLPIAYRIAKKPVRIPDVEDDAPTVEPSFIPESLEPVMPVSFFKTGADATVFQRPEGNKPRMALTYNPPRIYTPPPPPPPPPSIARVDKARLEAIIAQAKEESEAAEVAAMEKAARVEEEKTAALAEKLRSREEKKKRKRSETKGKADGSSSKINLSQKHKDKSYLNLIGQVVVKSMSKYKDEMDHEKFKKYAKECSQLILNKEKRSASFQSSPIPTALSEEKQVKMKKFTKEFAHKILRRLKEEKRSKGSEPSDPRPSSSVSRDLADQDEEAQLVAAVAAEMAAENPDPEDEEERMNVDEDEEDQEDEEEEKEEGRDGGDSVKRVALSDSMSASPMVSGFGSPYPYTPAETEVVGQVMVTGAILPAKDPSDDGISSW